MNRKLRGCLVACLLLFVTVFGGCLTVSPSVGADTADSPVFESVSTADSWGSSSVRASATLLDNATTELGVSKLTVISEGGSSFWTTSLSPGQTSTTLLLPPSGNATVVATNTVNGTTVDTRSITVDGNRLL